MNNSTLRLVILYGICTVIWSLKMIIDIFATTSTIVLVLDIACVIVWIIAFILIFKQYKSEEKNNKS